MPDRADLAIMQGDDYSAVVSVQYADGTPADITDFTAQAQIRTDFADKSETILAEFQTSVDSPEVNIYLSHEVTATLTPPACSGKKYVWDLQITSPTGQITTVLNGKVTVTQEVTREVAP